ncbi:T9SS type A sorting domain-containing protein [Hymenobacter lutimineralis]|uniref:T9SS type A sorting domain-containing protein n=1 Tax=Hymenobacter lutimineralis TaxID=2606448 RepID=A0A5D6VEB5_9BACT|nr:T9SS type A sorting domain-containing protein [Hymenobacter lutimineralis]TYZ14303.1 T9SS type A sorting domain-containing protein [Hymenobacter lutimineralis]
MKHLLLFSCLIAALAAASPSHAQQLSRNELVNKLFRREARHPDRQASQRGTQKATRHQRTASVSLPGRAIRHYWDEEDRAWVSGQITSYTYNAQGLVTQEVYTDSATNAINGRYQVTYNSRGDETESSYQGWDGTAYINSSRSQTTYDAQGNETLYTYQQWVDGAWETNGSYRTTNTYNPAGLLTSQVFEDFDLETNAWLPDSRQTYSFSAANQWTDLLFEDWDDELKKYVNDERIRNIAWHNWEDLSPSYYEQQTWDAMSGTWQGDERYTLTYEPNGSTTVVHQVMTAPNVWVNEGRYINTNDDYGNPTLEQEDEWIDNSWQIVDSYRYLLAYTATNQLRRKLTQEYNPEQERYENYSVETYANFVALAARRATGLEAATSLYPNPTSGYMTVAVAGLREQASVAVTITNALGQVLRTIVLPVQQGRISQQISLADLPAGLYLLQLHTREGLVVKRVVKH